MKYFLVFMLGFLLMACGPTVIDNRTHNHNPPGVDNVDPSGIIVIGTASFEVRVTGRGFGLAQTYPVVVALAPNSTLAISTVGFVVPTMSNSVLDFGNITVTAATTNQLKLCGTGGNQKCTKALLRVYTTVAAGAGFWNADGYGAPMTAGLSGSLQAVGLGIANVVTMEQYTIPGNRNSVKTSDFSPAPVFLFSGDFTDAGTGSYTTTVNIDFALAP